MLILKYRKGPRSFLSICSLPGADWIQARVQALGVKESLSKFSRDLLPGSWLQSKERITEPPQAKAWLYADRKLVLSSCHIPT